MAIGMMGAHAAGADIRKNKQQNEANSKQIQNLANLTTAMAEELVKSQNPISRAISRKQSRWVTEEQSDVKLQRGEGTSVSIDSINFNTYVLPDNLKPSEEDKVKKLSQKNFEIAKQVEKHLKDIAKNTKRIYDQDTSIKKKQPKMDVLVTDTANKLSDSLLSKLKKAAKNADENADKSNNAPSWFDKYLVLRLGWAITKLIGKTGWAVLKTVGKWGPRLGKFLVKSAWIIGKNALKIGAAIVSAPVKAIGFLIKFITHPIKTITGIWTMQKRRYLKYLAKKRLDKKKGVKLGKVATLMRLVKGAGKLGLVVAGVYVVSKLLGVQDSEWEAAGEYLVTKGKEFGYLIENTTLFKSMSNWYEGLDINADLTDFMNSMSDWWRKFKTNPGEGIVDFFGGVWGFGKYIVDILSGRYLGRKIKKYVYDGFLKPQLMDILDVNVDLGIYNFNLAKWIWSDEYKAYETRMQGGKGVMENFKSAWTGKHNFVKEYFIQKRKFNYDVLNGKTPSKNNIDRLADLQQKILDKTGIDISQFKDETDAMSNLKGEYKKREKLGRFEKKSLGEYTSMKFKQQSVKDLEAQKARNASLHKADKLRREFDSIVKKEMEGKKLTKKEINRLKTIPKEYKKLVNRELIKNVKFKDSKLKKNLDKYGDYLSNAAVKAGEYMENVGTKIVNAYEEWGSPEEQARRKKAMEELKNHFKEGEGFIVDNLDNFEEFAKQEQQNISQWYSGGGIQNAAKGIANKASPYLSQGANFLVNVGTAAINPVANAFGVDISSIAGTSFGDINSVLNMGMSGDYATYTKVIVSIETSSGKSIQQRWNEVNPKSKAFGLFQFLPKTWNGLAKKAGVQTVNVSNPKPPAPQAQLKVFKIWLNDLVNGLKNSNIPVNPLTVWFAHNQGLGGAQWLMGKRKSHPNGNATALRNLNANIPSKLKTGSVNIAKANYIQYYTKVVKKILNKNISLEKMGITGMNTSTNSGGGVGDLANMLSGVDGSAVGTAVNSISNAISSTLNSVNIGNVTVQSGDNIGNVPTTGLGSGWESKVDGAALAALKKLVATWKTVSNKPISVKSAYRNPQKNALVGGAKNSCHMSGKAFDLSTVGFSTEEYNALIETAGKCGFRGFGVSMKKTTLHVDICNARVWHYDMSGKWRHGNLPWAAAAVQKAWEYSKSSGINSIDTGTTISDAATITPQSDTAFLPGIGSIKLDGANKEIFQEISAIKRNMSLMNDGIAKISKDNTDDSLPSLEGDIDVSACNAK